MDCKTHNNSLPFVFIANDIKRPSLTHKPLGFFMGRDPALPTKLGRCSIVLNFQPHFVAQIPACIGEPIKNKKTYSVPDFSKPFTFAKLIVA